MLRYQLNYQLKYQLKLINKVILMETGETPLLSSSRCFARLILSLALRLANLYEVPLPKCDGEDKDLQALFVFLH